MASVLQSVFDIDAFKERYNNELKDHAKSCTNEPANCWYCQLHKLADGLLSGRYSQPQEPQTEGGTPSQQGIAPAMFKALVGKGHEEFSTMRQQDAYEFFQFFCKSVAQKEHANKQRDPTKFFEFNIEQRLQCGKCKKVRYQTDTTNSISVNVPARRKNDPTEAAEKKEEDAYEPVDFYECMNTFAQEETVEGYNCPSCNEKTTAFKYVPGNN